MRRLVPTLVRNRRLLALFLAMVLVPAVVFSVLMVRAIANEQLRVAYGTIERQRQIVRLAEADLNTWLFAAESDAGRSHAVVRFVTGDDHIAFPEFGLSLPIGTPQVRPFDEAPQSGALSADVIATHYYPRVQIFLRDLSTGRHAGAQYFLRLRSLVVRPRGDDEGYVIGIDPVVQYLNRRLAELCQSQPFTARALVAQAERTIAPSSDTYGLVNFPFFDIEFTETGMPAVMHVRRHAFAYAMTALMVIALLGSVFVHRAMSQEMRLSRLRQDFVAAVSHEFRSPLSSISMLAERLVSARTIDPPRLAEYHRIIERDSRRLSALVTRLLEFGRIEDGKAVYSLVPLDLLAVARESIAPFQTGEDPSRLRFATDSAGPLWIRGDRMAITHAVHNLIENAVKYSPADTPIDIRCGAGNDYHTIDVRDFGMGVAAAERDRIFDKFYRGESVQFSNIQGVGIGLALVKHVMDTHGGSVSVDSPPDGGACFRLSFPARHC